MASANSPNVGPLIKGGAAFLFIFLFYTVASVGVAPLLLEALVPPASLPALAASGGSSPRPVLAATNVPDLLYWASFALLGIALSLMIVVWCNRLLRTLLARAAYGRAILFLSAFALIAALISINNPMTMMELPRQLTCGTPPPIANAGGFLCQPNGSGSAPFLVNWSRDGWIDGVVRLKAILNIALQTAALFVLGAMLIIAATTRMSLRPGRYYARIVRTEAMTRLIVAAGATLSTITLTDILFANWPIAIASAPAAEVNKPLASVLGAFTFFYAALGTMVLVLTIFFSQGLAFRRLPMVPGDANSALGRLWKQAGSFLVKDTTIKALAALSPMLTALVGHPIITALLGALKPAA